ncbi:MAG: hypothetical protein L6Q31_02910 [Fimbriimonadaceae bacterium]|nr:hypothetical protein [Fimbriimonadaceae bacterium]NUM38794.1 hypothetical protein [Armatimonadota bacterium]
MSDHQAAKPDPNWLFELSGKPVPIEVAAIIRYFERAVFAFNHASNADAEPTVRAMLTPFCLHACQSLREALDSLAKAQPETDEKLREMVAKLPFAALIKDVREHDIHGHPLPVCDPNTVSTMVMSRVGSPVQMTCSDGAGIQIQMHGAEPVVTKPGDPSKAKLSPGQTVSYHCVDGDLGVWDYRTQTTYKLLGVLGMFLKDAQTLVVSVAQQVGT